jgi:hypothetical protein
MVGTRGYKKISVYMIENGYLTRKRVVDFGSFLGQQIEADKWRAWGKGKPLLLKLPLGRSRYTYLITPEVGWTLDGGSIVNIMMKGKQAALPKFSGKATYKVLPNGKNGEEAQVPSPPKINSLTPEDVGKLIDEKLNNGFKIELLGEIKQLLVSPKEPQVAANSPPVVTKVASQEAKQLEQKKAEEEIPNLTVDYSKNPSGESKQ